MDKELSIIRQLAADAQFRTEFLANPVGALESRGMDVGPESVAAMGIALETEPEGNVDGERRICWFHRRTTKELALSLEV